MILRQALEALLWMLTIAIAYEMIKWAVLRMINGEQKESREED